MSNLPQEKAGSFYDSTDFLIYVYQQIKPDAGEDSLDYCFTDRGLILGAFDGCGGSGSKIYPRCSDKTGAYMASRLVSAAFMHWYKLACSGRREINSIGGLTGIVNDFLKGLNSMGGSSGRIYGSLLKDFPTTAAAMTLKTGQQGIIANCLWAGDSRCYLLSGEGLCQLTEDDIDNLDALQNLSADGQLTNVICASQPFTIHTKRISAQEPCILFACSDGCFGYYTTPMEFEHMLLDTMARSESADEWQKLMHRALMGVAGDDFSLCGACRGFGSFENMKECFAERLEFIRDKYIEPLAGCGDEGKVRLWKEYSVNYGKYLQK